MTGPVRRSWLIVPAHDENALSEAADSSPDVVVLDLQDTVHDSRNAPPPAMSAMTVDWTPPPRLTTVIRGAERISPRPLCGPPAQGACPWRRA